MTAKYDVEYALRGRGFFQIKNFETDDPVACETFLMQALEKGYRIQHIHRDGAPLGGARFDNMIKTAAGMLAQEHLCKSLEVDSVEAHYRFGCPA
ncbi:MAG: hypothetical protein JWM68_145 [Verrucomicrobiales bacterium]|nr:hypothetical protein [Verrucomicrobiales bacterium]